MGSPEISCPAYLISFWTNEFGERSETHQHKKQWGIHIPFRVSNPFVLMGEMILFNSPYGSTYLSTEEYFRNKQPSECDTIGLPDTRITLKQAYEVCQAVLPHAQSGTKCMDCRHLPHLIMEELVSRGLMTEASKNQTLEAWGKLVYWVQGDFSSNFDAAISSDTMFGCCCCPAELFDLGPSMEIKVEKQPDMIFNLGDPKSSADVDMDSNSDDDFELIDYDMEDDQMPDSSQGLT